MSDEIHSPEEARLDEELSALIDGELDPERERALRARIVGEPALAERLAALENVDDALRALSRASVASVAQPAPDALSRLRDRIDAAPPGNVRRLPVWGVAAMAAAAAVVLYLAVSTGVEERPDTPPFAVAEDPAVSEAVALAELEALDEASEEEIGIAIDYDTLSDLEVIEELELLELMVELEDRREQG